jgi:hypothetical protein
MKRLLMLFSMVVVLALGGVSAIAADPGLDNPGSPGDVCSQGASNGLCGEDPQPDNGQECLDHGVARGNEDHCLGETEPPPS